MAMAGASWSKVVDYILLAYCFCSVTSRESPIVKTESGYVRGVAIESGHRKKLDAFLGIPYAEPPIGDLRFKHPLPKKPWSDIYNATKKPNTCYQIYDDYFGNFSGATMWNPNTNLSEDCLYLNIWVPYPRPKNSAVLIWIYGGGFYSGSSALDIYDGRILSSEENIIIASMNYRIGSLGFLCFQTEDKTCNAGMLDQLLAIKWIKKNIEHFGGNPNNITLFGESAGAVSVSMHLLSPLSWDYFNQAAMESGAANSVWATIDLEESNERATQLAKSFGCNLETTEENMECLRLIEPFDIINKEWVTQDMMVFPFVPVIDHYFLLESPKVSLENKRFKQTSIIMGSNTEEGSYFLIYFLTFLSRTEELKVTREDFKMSVEKIWPQMSSIVRESIIFQYTNWLQLEDSFANVDGLDKMTGDYFFTCNVNEFAHYYALAGNNVYMYYYSHRSSSHVWPNWMGVLHADEIEFLFGVPLDSSKKFTVAEIDLSKRMMKYWANFARTGDPNLGLDNQFMRVVWPVHTAHRREFLRLDHNDSSLGYGPRIKECAFWKEYLPQLITATKNISDVEAKWKKEFEDWSNNYIVEWKYQFDKYVASQNKKQYCTQN